jgi:hypothetical protein
MSPDEIERTIQFILQQQAQFVVDIDKLSSKTDRMTDGLIGLTAIVGRLATSQALTDQQLRATAEQLKVTAEEGRATDKRLRATDERLNLVIDMFERHLREDHGSAP